MNEETTGKEAKKGEVLLNRLHRLREEAVEAAKVATAVTTRLTGILVLPGTGKTEGEDQKEPQGLLPYSLFLTDQIKASLDILKGALLALDKAV